MKIIGEKVIHDRYGEGEIECIWNGEITVKFPYGSEPIRKFHLVEEADHFSFRSDELKKQILVEEVKRLKRDLYNLSVPESNHLVHARTHAAFINQVFHANLKGMRNCTWNYSGSIIVWIVRFHDEREEWQNRFLDSDTILQHYAGNEKRKFYHGKKDQHPYRLVVSVDDSDPYDRIYRIEGLFKIAREMCSLRDVYFERVSDELAHRLMPTLF